PARTRWPRPSSDAWVEDAHERAVEVRLRSRSAVAGPARAAGPGAVARGAPRAAGSRHRAAVLRRPAEQQAGRRLRLPPVRAAALPLGDQVRVAHGLAELLRALRPRAHHR